ncbi:hypothetical protein [Paenibacillus senegalensis]|uniref:hypothetical protein n=1 Tax=Paenibacillus senegalensis TaxID=1465766 RepID=UPI0002893891|nr:hypothetical protein [Paenibacillus senegalensis]
MEKVKNTVFPATFYTALTFMENLNNDDIVNSLEKQKQEITEVYKSMKAGYKLKKKAFGKVPDNINIIFDNMYEQCELQLKSIEAIIKSIKGN